MQRLLHSSSQQVDCPVAWMDLLLLGQTILTTPQQPNHLMALAQRLPSLSLEALEYDQCAMAVSLYSLKASSAPVATLLSAMESHLGQSDV